MVDFPLFPADTGIPLLFTVKTNHFTSEKVGRNSGELQKMQFLGIQSYHLRSARICIFLRYTHIPPFFGVRRTRLNGIIIPPYPEVTLDTFGFPVGGRLAAGWAVFRPRWPKVALFGPKSAVSARNQFLVHILQSNFLVTIMTRH